jgi:hypothetical protein
MIKTTLSCAVFALFVLNLSALDITTTDGKVYKDVTVTNVMPDAVGFMYTKADGVTTVLRDVKLAMLTKNLQKEFNYSPKKAEEFEKQSNAYEKKRNQLLIKHHQEDLRLFREQKKAARELDDIKAMLRAHTINCWVHVIRSVGSNDCIAEMTSTKSATSASGYGYLGKIYIRNLNGPQNTRLEVKLFPTGESRSFEDGTFPVYDTDLNGYALKILHEKEQGETPVTPENMVFPANAPAPKKKN